MEAIYIEVRAEVRYWESATVNGAIDADGTLIPHRSGDIWAPVIRLADGKVMDWPAGVEADVYYKVCDAGTYFLQDADRKRVAEWAGYYVPNSFLCHGDEGYGDYIILKIGGDGLIRGYTVPDVELTCRCDDDDDGQSAWRKLDDAK